MSRKMLINVLHPEESRVAIVEDGHLVELEVEVEGSEQTRGNVYKGTVVRVEPGLQAAFIDIGMKKLGFLQMGELHPDYWQWRDDIPEKDRKRRPRIHEVLRRGQELLVQVEKGERDMKGASLTTYLSLPGRYMVIMPGSDSSGVSRKVEGEAERKKLKELTADLKIPEGIGYIIRTEAVGKTKTELGKDFKYLLKLHKSIIDKAKGVKAPALIYQESHLVIRTIRDYFTAAIDEVLVDSKDVYEQIRAFFKETMPKSEKLVKLHQEKRPIFSKYQLEEQIDLIYEKKVPLKSGGSLVIEPTEALVSIDVNSGKSTGERGVEDTAFKTNMEAAEEAARQLRLRDLGGLIVIDFIDMRDRKHNADVEKTLKNALKADKARVTVGKISQFGILEMSRQRIKQNLDQAIHLECPHCGGRGKVKNVESMAVSFLRKVHGAAAKGTAAEVRGALPLEVAYYLLNRKKRELAQIETDYDIEVTVKGKPSFLMNQLELEQIRREKPSHVEHHDEAAAPVTAISVQGPVTSEDAGAETEQPVAHGEEGKGKRKRRRKKKGRSEEGGAPGETTSVEIAVIMNSVSEEQEHPVEPAGQPETEDEQSAAKKKRRRRRRRGKGGSVEGALTEGAASEAPDSETQVPQPETSPASAGEAEVGLPEGEVRKKRRRRRRRGKGGATEGAQSAEQSVSAADVAAVFEAASEPPAVAVTVSAKKPRASRARKAVASAPENVEPAAATVEAPSAGSAIKPARSRKKGAIPTAGSLPPPVPELPVEQPLEKPKRQRSPRKKAVPADE